MGPRPQPLRIGNEGGSCRKTAEVQAPIDGAADIDVGHGEALATNEGTFLKVPFQGGEGALEAAPTDHRFLLGCRPKLEQTRGHGLFEWASGEKHPAEVVRQLL